MNNCIYLDIGNSTTKWKFNETYFELPTSQFNLDKLPKSSNIVLSNVSNDVVISKKSNIFVVESQPSYKSLKNSYQVPSLLGSDRWLAMIACYEMCQENGFVVIDIGSAVTVDVVDSFGSHQGGLIFPGLHKIRQTFDFPINNNCNIQILGKSTQEAWSIGTLGLLINSINFRLDELKNEYPDAHIYITGGGFEEVKKLIQFPYVYQKNLVLDGLEFFADNMR